MLSALISIIICSSYLLFCGDKFSSHFFILEIDLIHQIRHSISNYSDSSIENIKSTYLKIWSYLKAIFSSVVEKLEALTQKQQQPAQQQRDESSKQSSSSPSQSQWRQEPAQVTPTPTKISIEERPTSVPTQNSSSISDSVCQFLRTIFKNFVAKMKSDAEFSEHVLTCAGLAIVGLLCGGWIGSIFGAISGVVIALGLSSITPRKFSFFFFFVKVTKSF